MVVGSILFTSYFYLVDAEFTANSSLKVSSLNAGRKDNTQFVLSCFQIFFIDSFIILRLEVQIKSRPLVGCFHFVYTCQ